MGKVKIKIHWAFAVLGILMLVFGKFMQFCCSILVVLLHEMGHSIAGRKLGYSLDMITLLPYGALLSGKNTPFSAKDEIKIAIAGPLMNAILILLNILLWWFFPSIFSINNMFFTANVYTLVFNILPIFPLDGGRIFVALLSSKMPRAKANWYARIVGYVITSVFFIMFFISLFFKLNYMLGINALFLLIELFGEDTAPYYQKMKNFETVSFFGEYKKNVKLDESETIFAAYKCITEKNAKTIQVCQNGEVVKNVSKNKILTSVLNLPIDTKLQSIID